MKIPYFCCIGAELKRYAKDFDFMNQVYLYKVPTDDSIDEVLAEDYFKAISDSVLQDDIVYVYEASAETLHECRFNKQNGHITAVPLASDETLTGAVTTIIHDNLTKNRAVISNNDGKVAVSEVTSTELGYLHGATSNIQEQLNKKAKTDLSNLTSAGKNIGNWSSNVTNCITEIPQDIKLELNNGTLTLKAGSKAYLPDGTTYSASQDTVLDNSQFGTATNTFVLAMTVNNVIFPRLLSNCVSGAGVTTVGGYAYDTTTNVISWYNSQGSVGGTNVSFPIAIFHTTNGVPDRIDQVFNGFGYIGSTLFALPGVKGLIPNGRNADGSLKNTLRTTTTVSVYTVSAPVDATYQLAYNGGVAPFYNHMIYNAKENLNYSTSGTVLAWGIVGTATFSSGKITKFNPKTVFHAVDYNDTEYIAHQAMPSGRYINLTLGASGTNYTAPADGYVCFHMSQPSSHDLQVYLSNKTAQVKVRTYQNTNDIACWIPVSKGDTFYLEYTYNSGSYQFRFIYANGAQ